MPNDVENQRNTIVVKKTAPQKADQFIIYTARNETKIQTSVQLH